jgi:hypothetical protein
MSGEGLSSLGVSTMKLALAAAAAAFALGLAGAASAETLTFSATLNAATEVPPNDSTGTGQVTATLDTATDVLSYNVTYQGLSGPALAAHFHGPAAVGANAPPVITMQSLASPIAGSATLTAAQVADFEAGKWYFNVHTAAHKSGEIRGWLVGSQ